jgi:hypothetical protein
MDAARPVSTRQQTSAPSPRNLPGGQYPGTVPSLTSVRSHLSITIAIVFPNILYREGGHLHDSGKSVHVYHNGNLVCETNATYAGATEYTEKSTGRYGMNGMKHISSMQNCTDVIPVKKNDVLTMTAGSDFAEHPG